MNNFEKYDMIELANWCRQFGGKVMIDEFALLLFLQEKEEKNKISIIRQSNSIGVFAHDFH